MAPPDRYRPRKQPKQDRAKETRQRVLDAAAQVFSEYGYSASTTNRIAEYARLSIGSLYQYFPNKDAILRALMEQHVEAGMTLLAQRIADGLPGRLDATLRIVVRAAIENHSHDPGLHRVLFEEAPRSPAFLDRLHSLEDMAVASTAQLLAQYSEVNVNDSATAARVIVVTIESLVHRLIATPAPVPAAVVEDVIVTMLCGYLTGSAG
ncbi:TetR/AcrR family transcriptional regulator [Mycolicibacter arupensis]|uniref:TetR/AcrR family transcriptional regulator n=1 Tax=Mycolicibacter arupensis TaxID=342002 RepID=A0A5B1MBT3_9MYCO|nr:TetR/AcrR family transcriptional regulator [Mycolicibacter arupensis]KAA1430058.1 TetR/AcrR family transcriptional regulator [Mycolicibacter arupensis]TXI52777.1 MAG: TetR/AcrR family transcriptional regulator [Mycolicibacter arupensis]